MPTPARSLLTAAQRRQLTAALNQFYSQPVARVSFELFITILAVLFFAVFAIRPTLLTMSDLIKEIDEKEELDQALTQKIAALNTAQAVYLNLQDRLETLEAALPNQPELIPALKILEKIASDRGIPIVTMTVDEFPEDVPADKSFSDLTRRNVFVTITVTGTYPNIRQMVEDIRNSQRSFVIESVKFSTTDQRGEKTLRASITLNVPYYGVAEQKKSSGPAKATGITGELQNK